jgi:hypothetical protein
MRRINAGLQASQLIPSTLNRIGPASETFLPLIAPTVRFDARARFVCDARNHRYPM